MSAEKKIQKEHKANEHILKLKKEDIVTEALLTLLIGQCAVNTRGIGEMAFLKRYVYIYIMTSHQSDQLVRGISHKLKTHPSSTNFMEI